MPTNRPASQNDFCLKTPKEIFHFYVLVSWSLKNFGFLPNMIKSDFPVAFLT